MGAIHRVVIVGGGFGGLQAARALKRAPVEVTLLDRRNFHLFQPLLYQVATGALSPANIASPLRAVLKRQRNATVVLGEATGFDLAGRRVLTREGAIPYDTLIVAAGTRHHYFGHDDWEALAPGLKTVEDATTIRRRVLIAFEAAERATDAADRAAWLTIVIVGGGPTGVELAGAIGELAHWTFRGNFRRIDPTQARILLVEGSDAILTMYPDPLPQRAIESLARLGVTVLTGARLVGLDAEGVVLDRGGTRERIAAHTTLWAAGVVASPLGRALVPAAGPAAPGAASLDRAGRVLVQPDLTLPGHPEVFVIGDLALLNGADGQPLPGVAPVAIQEGRHVARAIVRRLAGGSSGAFVYHDHGSMATIGRAAAVAVIGRLKLTGYLAWLAWLFVHLMNLVQFESRVLVLAQWAWNYVTRNRSARLITGEPPAPPGAAPPAPEPPAAPIPPAR
ncbi:MAG TPA: NAD(P)/FAD-dependent oxidoreductase [Dongiaceae bacterium]|nr:NAD(P)/FAD-dependent oxidoreductase [Dongiaceae bacterium]